MSVSRLILLAASAAALCLSPVHVCGRDLPRPCLCDPQSAREWCDTTALHPVEGVWLWPDDDVTVAVCREPESLPARYALHVVATPDCSLAPGEVLGYLEPTTDARRFRLSVYTGRRRKTLDGLAGCAVTMSDDNNALRVESPKIKIKWNAVSLLPRFWRLVRISVDDPASRLPAGLVRLYPSADGDGDRRTYPLYL